MDIPTCVLDPPVFPSPIRSPLNGFNGSLHEVFFIGPAYHPDRYSGDCFITPMTWNMIDRYANSISVWCMTLGVSLGMMLTTLLYVLFVTPTSKRWKPFHSSLLAALLLISIHLVVVCTQTTSMTHGLNPAYPIITKDYEFSYTATFITWRSSGTGLLLLAVIFTLACLFIQAKATLVGLRLTHRAVHIILLIYLLLATVACIIARILAFAIQAQLLLAHPRTTTTTIIGPTAIFMANSALTAIVIGSYSLITFLSVMHNIWTRGALLGWRCLLAQGGGGTNRNHRYDRALAVLAFVLLESLVGPLILAIMIPLPDPDAGWARPEILLMPVLLTLMPFGALFSGREGEGERAADNRRRQQRQQQGVAVSACSGQQKNAFHAYESAGAVAGFVHPPDLDVVHLAELSAGDSGQWGQMLPRKPAAPPNAVDRELAALDAL